MRTWSVRAMFRRGLQFAVICFSPFTLFSQSTSGASSGAAALTHLQPGRAYALTADKDFLTFWKDADPNIPVLKEAKEEYAKLQ
jgi:hypothetical protein